MDTPMPVTGASTCPNCEFQNTGTAQLATDDGKVNICGHCGTKWRDIPPVRTGLSASSRTARRTKPVNALDSRIFLAGRTVVSGKTFKAEEYNAKPHKDEDYFSRGPSSSSTAHPFGQLSKKFYAVILALPILAILTALFLNTDDRFEASLEISEVTLRKVAGRRGVLAQITGRISNNSGQTHALPDLALVLFSKDGQKLLTWRYSPPVDSIAPGSKLQFATTIGNIPNSADRVEAEFSDRMDVASR